LYAKQIMVLMSYEFYPIQELLLSLQSFNVTPLRTIWFFSTCTKIFAVLVAHDIAVLY
jgi:hypothetical protein